MSDNFIVLVSCDPGWRAEPDVQEQVAAILWRLAPLAGSVTPEVSEAIGFHDAGSNFESIHCPRCAAQISIDWWQDRMDEDYDSDRGGAEGGHPKDLPVLQNDIMDPLAGSEERLLEMRRGTLQAEAFGVSSVGPGFLVFFESVPPDTSGAYRTLEVDEEEHARILHQDMFPGWYKRTER